MMYRIIQLVLDVHTAPHSVVGLKCIHLLVRFKVCALIIQVQRILFVKGYVEMKGVNC